MVIAQPIIVGSFTDGDLTFLAYARTAVWAVGMLFEAVGDWQLEQYKKDPSRGPVMDRGLWHYTRHPNYFGDTCAGGDLPRCGRAVAERADVRLAGGDCPPAGPEHNKGG
jgi:steroid 5-alpha reductase family enzyme